MLQRELGDKVEIVNAAVIGYSSEQARTALLREYYKYKPDGLLLYLGNNDGFGSRAPDRALLEATKPRKSWFGDVETWLVDHSAIYVSLKMLAKYINRAFDTDFSDEALKFRRVPIDQSRENFNGIVRWARDAGVDIYVVVPPVPLEYPPRILEYDFRRSYEPGFVRRNGCLEPGKSPERSAAGACWPPKSPRRVIRNTTCRSEDTRILCCAALRAASTSSANALPRWSRPAARIPTCTTITATCWRGPAICRPPTASFLKAIELAPKIPQFHYNAGMDYRQLGEEEKGLAELQAALDLDFTSARIQSPYVALLKQIAGSDSRIVLIDAKTIFQGCDNETLFADHVHPNEKGQALVARIVARALAARLRGGPEGQAACGS